VYILAVSDQIHPALYEHLDRTRFPAIHALISCGDLPDYYLDFLASTFDVPAFYVRGNHDVDSAPSGWVNLDGRVVTLGPLRLVGFEGARLYTNRAAVQYTDREMWWKVRKTLPRIWWNGGVDIVVTHAPPRGFHEGGDLAHQGLEAFRWLMDKYRPRFFLHGHQHLNYAPFQERVTRVGKTTLINTFGYYILEV
jgi:Icc-related predicted phosphoesterase